MKSIERVTEALRASKRYFLGVLIALSVSTSSYAHNDVQQICFNDPMYYLLIIYLTDERRITVQYRDCVEVDVTKIERMEYR